MKKNSRVFLLAGVLYIVSYIASTHAGWDSGTAYRYVNYARHPVQEARHQEDEKKNNKGCVLYFQPGRSVFGLLFTREDASREREAANKDDKVSGFLVAELPFGNDYIGEVSQLDLQMMFGGAEIVSLENLNENILNRYPELSLQRLQKLRQLASNFSAGRFPFTSWKSFTDQGKERDRKEPIKEPVLVAGFLVMVAIGILASRMNRGAVVSVE